MEAVNLISPWSELGESQVKVRLCSSTGRPLSVRLELSWSWQARGLLMLGRGDMKLPTRLALPSLCSAPLACSRKESKLSDGLVVRRWTASILSGAHSLLSHIFTLVFPVSPVLIKVHDDLKGWISLARSPRSIKEPTVLLLLHGDPRGLPVLLHVDWLQGVTGGEVVPSYYHLSTSVPQYLSTRDIDLDLPQDRLAHTCTNQKQEREEDGQHDDVSALDARSNYAD